MSNQVIKMSSQNEKLLLQACPTLAAHIEQFHLDKVFQTFTVISFSDI